MAAFCGGRYVASCPAPTSLVLCDGQSARVIRVSADGLAFAPTIVRATCARLELLQQGTGCLLATLPPPPPPPNRELRKRDHTALLLSPSYLSARPRRICFPVPVPAEQEAGEERKRRASIAEEQEALANGGEPLVDDNGTAIEEKAEEDEEGGNKALQNSETVGYPAWRLALYWLVSNQTFQVMVPSWDRAEAGSGRGGGGRWGGLAPDGLL